ncbi:MAG: beta-L-arabinofuranosidase domain-containing protein [Pirellulales bacterium]
MLRTIVLPFGRCLLVICVVACAAPMAPCWAESKEGGEPLLVQPARVQYTFTGTMGQRVQANLENWLLPAPIANPGMTEMFRLRDRQPQPALVPWAGEFVGKYLISAIQARRMTADPRLDRTIRRVIAEVTAMQAKDGYLGPFKRNERLLGHWDLWGHYHVMQALLMWSEETGDAAARQAAVQAGDLICRTYLGTERRPIEAGSPEMNLAVLHVLGRLYRQTHTDRYLKMMRVIEEDWQQAGDYFRQGLAGVPFHRTPRPRWESLHDIQGLAELFFISGNADYRTALVRLWRSMANFDRHNTGGFTTNEAAIGNPYTPGAIETCCTTAWSALSIDALCLSGDSTVADELEWSLWNSILGSQHPSGRWWTYNTPMDGKREASADTIVFQARAGTPELNCCSVNAPRGLGMISEWGLLTSRRHDVVINYYGPMTAQVELHNGRTITVVQETDYPRGGTIRMKFLGAGKEVLPVRLRIPTWAGSARIAINGELLEEAVAGTYLEISRTWSDRDRLEIQFPMSLRTWVGDGAVTGKVSIFRGPILLAYDQRFNTYDADQIPPIDVGHFEGEFEPAEASRFAPIVLMAIRGKEGRRVGLCDFATAGALGTEYRTWLPATHAPPPRPLPVQPYDGARVATGVQRFRWSGPASNADRKYTFLLATDAAMKQPIVKQGPLTSPWAIVRKTLEEGKSYYWDVIATNRYGRASSMGGPFALVVDATLSNPLEDHPALLEFRRDGLVAGSHLHGNGSPVYGYLDVANNVVAAPGRSGKAGQAVQFSGDGMLRYRIAYFPETDYTLVVWIRPEPGVPGRLAQVASAWSRVGDDPLRVVITDDRLYARMEARGNRSTKGAAVRFGQWMHVAVVKAGPSLTLLLDGKPFDRIAVPSTVSGTTAADFALGTNPHYSGREFYAGRMEDFAFYARALSNEEIAAIFREGLKLD